jgi:transposase
MGELEFKRYLETRPMFHWTEKRIEGHLCLCYIAYTLLNYLRRQLLKNGKQQSENKIRENLCKMQLSKIEDNGKEFYLRSYLNDGMKDILKSLGIRRLPDIIKSDDINDYIS